jgi:predicted DNA-binding ribbon-helix-helix protein
LAVAAAGYLPTAPTPLSGTRPDALADIADERGKTVYDLIAEIHRNHNQANLSSAIRVYIVEYYRAVLQTARADFTHASTFGSPCTASISSARV